MAIGELKKAQSDFLVRDIINGRERREHDKVTRRNREREALTKTLTKAHKAHNDGPFGFDRTCVRKNSPVETREFFTLLPSGPAGLLVFGLLLDLGVFASWR